MAGLAAVVGARGSSGALYEFDRAELAATVDGFFYELVDTGVVPGAAVAVVDVNGTALLSGYGLADVEAGRAVDPATTVFRVGSVSKAVNATLVLALEARGDVDLDSDVRERLAAEGVHLPGSDPITLRHLLGHTAGFDEGLFGQHARAADDWQPLGRYLARHPFARFAPAGDLIAYNDLGISLSGLLVEMATGLDYSTAADTYLFGPLGVTSTTFAQVDLPGTVAASRARAYRRVGERWEPYEWDFVHTTPAAGLWTAAADMARYVSLQVHPDGQTVLSADSIRRQQERWSGNHPASAGRAAGFTEIDYRGWRVLAKDGQASGFSARVVVVPELGIGWFSVANRSVFEPGWRFNRASRIHRELAARILEGVPHGRERPAPEALPAGRRTPVELLAGTYRTVVGSRTTPEKILFLGQELPVRAGADGSIEAAGIEWNEIEAGVFAPRDGGTMRLTFPLGGRDRADHCFLGAGAYELLPWYETARCALVVAVSCAVLFVLTVLAGPRSRRRWTPPIRRALDAATLAAGLYLAFGALFFGSFLLLDPQRFFYGLPALMRGALLLPPLALLTSLLALWLGVRGWGRSSASDRLGRWALATLGIALTAFPALLGIWQLLWLPF
jgi:CubicO group peptidase (beta-lactamase class C family)